MLDALLSNDITLSVGMVETLNKIFAAILIGGLDKDNEKLEAKVNNFKVCSSRFAAYFPFNIFQNEYAFLYEILMTAKIKVYTENQLSDLVETHRDLILDSPYINLDKLSITVDDRNTTEDEKVEVFKEDLLEMFNRLSNIYVSEEEFISSCEIFIDYFKNNYMSLVSQRMAMIMTDSGIEEKQTGKRRKFYRGYDDAQYYYNEKMAVLRALSEEDRIKSKVIDDSWLQDELDKENSKQREEETILDFGIDEIDKVMGGLQRSNMLGLLGPPKGGKTRMANYLVQRALSRGLNVAVWPIEGNDKEWEATQLSCYIKINHGITINSKDIRLRRYESDKIRQLVLSSKVALARSPKMGRLSFIEGTAYVEDFIDVLKTHYDNENPFDVIVIDQMINILSKKNKNKPERISEGYMLLKNFITNKLKVPAIAILPAQLKQSTVDYLRNNPDETIDITAGAESADTIRSPDEIIGLFSTKEERAAGIMRVYSVGSRHSGTFEDCAVGCELGSCYFYSEPGLNK